ncbi:hypothetical protein AB0I77_04810 [Streptomyces sp. NPDC050619]|uniref:hypothetical protein n=1 Tax=Streptomyces sp. NPDC050619 TaxID=3157214 RepID=UPI0034490B33
MYDFAVRRGIALATGSRPRVLPGLVPDGRRVVTNDDALFRPPAARAAARHPVHPDTGNPAGTNVPTRRR